MDRDLARAAAATAALSLLLSLAHAGGALAQVDDDFNDGNLDGWTVLTTGQAAVGLSPQGTLVMSGAGSGPGSGGAALRLDASLDDPEGYAAGQASFDLRLAVGGRAVEAGIEIKGDPSTGAAMVFVVFNNNPGGPGASIAFRESAAGPLVKLAAPAIPFDPEWVFVRVVWSESDYRFTVSDRNNPGQAVTFEVQMPGGSEATGLSLVARPVIGPSPDDGAWSAVFDDFSAIPDTALDCLADVNQDAVLSPADFTAWIIAFNTQGPGCDQNLDGLCTPADYSAWILNWNAGC